MATPIEQDTIDNEDIPNLQEFCYPSLDVLNQTMTVGVTYKKNVFDAWVKQPSPCCGAASIAGSINALLRLHRSSEKAFNHLDILQVHKLLFIYRINQKHKSFERKIGFNALEKFFIPLASIMEPLILEEKSSRQQENKTKLTLAMKRKLLLTALEKFIENVSLSTAANTVQDTLSPPPTATVTPEGIEADSFQSFLSQLKSAITTSFTNSSTSEVSI
jgi:hypothetical protein